MKYQVSNRQVFFTYFSIMSLSFAIPNLVIKDLGQDFWQAVLIAMVNEAVLGWMLYKMGLKFQRQTLFQYSEKILGKFLGKVSNILFIAYFMFISFTTLQVLVDLFGSVIMPETPSFIFSLILLLVSTYAVYAGLEVVMRLAGLIAPFVLGSSLFILLLNINKMDSWNLRPMFQHSIGEVVRGTLLPAAWFGACIVMGVIMAYQKSPKDALKIKFFGVGIGILVFALNILAVILAIGVEVSSRQIYSVFLLAQIVEVGDFIERMEAVQVVSWTAGGFFIIALFHYVAVEGIQQILPKRSRLILASSVAFILFTTSVFANPSSQAKTLFLKNIFSYYALGFEIGSVTLLYLIYRIKEKFNGLKKRNANAK